MGNINNNENTADNSRTEIDIAEIFGMLAHKWVIIVAAGVIAAVLAFGYFHFIATPKYTSSASIMVINRQNTTQSQRPILLLRQLFPMTMLKLLNQGPHLNR